MPEPLFCPICFSKNDSTADYCAFCQTPLRQRRFADVHTTARVASDLTPPATNFPCQERMIAVPRLGFSLLMMHQAEPVIVGPGEAHVLGRFDTGSEETPGLIDLTDYGAMELGVSRRHAEIRYTGGAFVISDLDSTNGTWLNQTRLTPGVSHILQSNDQIVLGKLILWICLDDGEAAPALDRARFSLRGAAAPTGLAVAALQAEVLPYLEALTAVQQLLDQWGSRPPQSPILHELTVKETAVITVELSGISQAVQAVQRHLAPWRARHPDLVGAALEEFSFLLEAEFEEMAAAILDDHAPNLPADQIAAATLALRPWLEQLAAHPMRIED